MVSTVRDRFAGFDAGAAIKQPCRVASTASLTLSSTQVIDGIAVSTGERVLVKDNDSSDNGIYVVGSGAWSRAADFDGVRDAVRGTLVYVTTGAFNGDKWYAVSSTGINVPGSSGISFANAGRVGSTVSVSAAGEELIDDSTFATMRATLGLQGALITTATGLITGSTVLASTALASAVVSTATGFMTLSTGLAAMSTFFETLINDTTKSAVRETIGALGSTVAGRPAFSVRLGSSATINSSAVTKLSFNTEDFDTDGKFDASADFSFQPNTTGLYLLSAGALLQNVAAGRSFYVSIFKDSSEVKRLGQASKNDSVNPFQIAGSVLAEAASTSVFDARIYHNSTGTIEVDDSAAFTYFQGHRVGD